METWIIVAICVVGAVILIAIFARRGGSGAGASGEDVALTINVYVISALGERRDEISGECIAELVDLMTLILEGIASGTGRSFVEVVAHAGPEVAEIIPLALQGRTAEPDDLASWELFRGAFERHGYV